AGGGADRGRCGGGLWEGGRNLSRVRLGGVTWSLEVGGGDHEDGPWLGGMHLHRVGIDDLHAIDRLEVGAAAHRGILHALQAVLHGVCVEVFSVVELDALAQLDLPHRGREELRHLRGEAGDQLDVLIALYQGAVETVGDDGGGGLLLVHRDERGRLAARGDHDLAFGGRRTRKGCRESNERDGERRAETYPGHVCLLG